jgi:putative ABC transport system permease protein
MLNWHLLRWLLLSFALAIPLALFAMNQWLKNFAYKTTLSWWIFAVAGLIAVLISFVAISVNSWKAASTNPVNVLRDE